MLLRHFVCFTARRHRHFRQHHRNVSLSTIISNIIEHRILPIRSPKKVPFNKLKNLDLHFFGAPENSKLSYGKLIIVCRTIGIPWTTSISRSNNCATND